QALGRGAGHGDPEVALGGEVVEQQASGDPGGGGYLVDRELVEGAVGQHLEPQLHKLRPAGLRIEADPRVCASGHTGSLLTVAQYVEYLIEQGSTARGDPPRCDVHLSPPRR